VISKTFQRPFSIWEHRSTLENILCGKTRCDGAMIHLLGRRFRIFTRTWFFWSPILEAAVCYDRTFTFSQWKVCLILGCNGQTKTYKILLQYNIYSTYKIKCIPNAIWDKAAESLVTSSNSYTPVTGDVRLFDCQISGVSKNLARWNLHHTRSGNEHWESDFCIFYETKHSIKNWRTPISHLHLNKAAS